MKDKSLFDNTNNSENIEYINECVREVCINDDDIHKYKIMIKKLFPDDSQFYLKVVMFVNKCKDLQTSNSSVSATSIANIEYLAKEINVSEDTFNAIVDNIKFRKNELLKQKKIELEIAQRELEELQKRKSELEEENKRKAVEKAKIRKQAKIKAKAETEQKEQKKTGCLALFLKVLLHFFAMTCVSALFGSFGLPAIGGLIFICWIVYLGYTIREQDSKNKI